MTFIVEDGSGAPFFEAATAVVAAGGTGYAVGQTITLTGGTFSRATILKVATITGSAVATVMIDRPGQYTVVPTNPVAQGSSSGGGTGATFTMTYALAIANAYVSDAFFDTFHTDRNVTVVVEDDFTRAEIEAAIVRATDYIDKRFGRRFRGWRRTQPQPLEWPRIDAFDDDDYLFPNIPVQLQRATAEYALLTLQLGPLAPVPGKPFSTVDPATGDVTTDASGRLVEKSERVGPIEESNRYESTSGSVPMSSTGNQIQEIPAWPQADLWIEELTRSITSRSVVRG